VNAAGFFAVGVGAMLGAWLRWGLSVALNTVVPTLPLGTLAANLIGGYLIGIAVESVLQLHLVSIEWRLFIITGFLGGLTTFSTFSAEAVELMAQQRYGWAAAHIGSHLAGSLIMTFLGIWTVRWLAA
jgi:fluoride exporter